MPVEITSAEKELYTREREMEKQLEEEEAPEWNIELIKMSSSLMLNLIVISILAYAAVTTSQDLSSRFMSLLEIVIGAIFGVTATQIAKE